MTHMSWEQAQVMMNTTSITSKCNSNTTSKLELNKNENVGENSQLAQTIKENEMKQ